MNIFKQGSERIKSWPNIWMISLIFGKILLNMERKLVIIPTYNEKENVENIIRTVFKLNDGIDVLIVDDGSPDGTATIVKALQKEFTEGLNMIEREGKLGLGTAYITGFKWALEKDYDIVCEMDADFSHNPNDLPKLFNACATTTDVAIGSRYVTGVNVVNWPMGRVLMSFFASKYVRIVTGLKAQDTTAGFVCYRAEALRTIELDKIRFIGYAFQIEMKFTAWKCGFTIEEVPIIFVNRVLGTSKMSGGIFNEAVWGVIKLKLRSLFRTYPQKGTK
jgi:dolichol-phosphate mannosyltransferase